MDRLECYRSCRDVFTLSKYRNALPIAIQKAALIQFAVCRASRVARPKKSRNIVKLVPNVSFLISTSVRVGSHRTSNRAGNLGTAMIRSAILQRDGIQLRRLRAFALRLVNFPQRCRERRSIPDTFLESCEARTLRMMYVVFPGHSRRR